MGKNWSWTSRLGEKESEILKGRKVPRADGCCACWGSQWCWRKNYSSFHNLWLTKVLFWSISGCHGNRSTFRKTGHIYYLHLQPKVAWNHSSSQSWGTSLRPPRSIIQYFQAEVWHTNGWSSEARNTGKGESSYCHNRISGKRSTLCAYPSHHGCWM